MKFSSGEQASRKWMLAGEKDKLVFGAEGVFEVTEGGCVFFVSFLAEPNLSFSCREHVIKFV